MAKDENEKLNFVINDGDSFYANEISVSFGPAQFSIDYKNITPRIDMRSQDGTKTFALKHNVIIIDPYQVKSFIKVLEESVSTYEKQFGTIDMPKPLKNAEKRLKLENKTSKQIPSYFG